jgi:hypothetical protein
MLYYIAGADLFKFDPHNSTATLLGRVPFTSAGDLVFYKDKLLLASTMGVVEIDTTAHPMVSTLLMATPGHNFFGVFNIPFGCNANRVYGIESTAANSGTIVELDLDNKKILGNYCTLPVGVNDNKIKQACLDEGRGMVGCVVTFENQMDSLITLSLQKLYAKGSRASNLALENDQKNWLAKRKIYYKKAIKNGHADAIKGGWNGGSMENLLIAGDITNFVERRAEVLIKKLNKQKI